MTRLVNVYRSSRRQEMYLYVDAAEDLARVPADLLGRFGTPVLVLAIELDAERRLARAEAGQVLARIETAGFYLQMPPQPEVPPDGAGR
ncbi:MAG: YcgL domain-containing protein [Pseudomonadales bacterium]|nr:YcgL domain-containing protein [Pseudomonadales bacterium]